MAENNFNKYIEKKCLKYVIATLDNPTMYLKYLLDGKYSFVEDIEYATKTLKCKLANDIKDYYYKDTGMDTELIVIPVEVTYELINTVD